ncbi:hypothetical protein T492DRAFT_996737 [Pavlovales sp. CCMP2436]|nr:hypothetical protein T492DRAFT_996737 [Pavlovales sp. CCMP2436]|mmetsp:Transcript_48824/g.114340  ORF Transcript_48824/g.114340 Transcript_48824/m.114340 type:complete len:247 (-) Transcript_48824:181-921(-)|eukprot:CAMPEP_0179966120 /NCGR_PEP_ID=MMETSP0983-20121128/32309_1 /TAXON_ID=483367 /ORGANISM="non described non described, Strain CCMP 2436" /LENGTH=246 /DNA_ID=CAMNT_0021879125 /DNA_START=111 /DNA_END=851 /DNA_ORIENTATION=-
MEGEKRASGEKRSGTCYWVDAIYKPSKAPKAPKAPKEPKAPKPPKESKPPKPAAGGKGEKRPASAKPASAKKPRADAAPEPAFATGTKFVVEFEGKSKVVELEMRLFDDCNRGEAEDAQDDVARDATKLVCKIDLAELARCVLTPAVCPAHLVQTSEHPTAAAAVDCASSWLDAWYSRAVSLVDEVNVSDAEWSSGFKPPANVPPHKVEGGQLAFTAAFTRFIDPYGCDVYCVAVSTLTARVVCVA